MLLLVRQIIRCQGVEEGGHPCWDFGIQHYQCLSIEEVLEQGCGEVEVVTWVVQVSVGLEHGGVAWVKESAYGRLWVRWDFISVLQDHWKNHALCHCKESVPPLCFSFRFVMQRDKWRRDSALWRYVTASLRNPVSPERSCGATGRVGERRAILWAKQTRNHYLANLSLHRGRGTASILGASNVTDYINDIILL